MNTVEPGEAAETAGGAAHACRSPGGRRAPSQPPGGAAAGGAQRKCPPLPTALGMRPPRAGRGREAAAERDEAAAAGAGAAGSAAGSGAAGRRRCAVPGPATPRPTRPRHPPPRQVRPAAGGERAPPRGGLRQRSPLLPSGHPSTHTLSAPSWGHRVGAAKWDWARGQGRGQPSGTRPGDRDSFVGPGLGWGDLSVGPSRHCVVLLLRLAALDKALFSGGFNIKLGISPWSAALS